ncbi:LysR family transcriptional regulator [Thiothrix litoralis]|jgi:DNA-binding transcriptional LysR family regulator|uniref:LysR family transcriptional regulator n=1 Tax=Thiothrix litoralis TaxID=2891210 RepID=A0ABX7WZC3_9GAMM|nr:LysR family transcriptional regulator [Thiothrix litoralis]QTR46979.1 LysR family transcriptional regulator [Thiothrix litoralis]
MPYSLSQIRIFEAVAQYESYTRAAEKLFMTQPAVSMQIKQMEEHSGLALFERQGKKMCLTPIGREVQQYASRVLQAHNDMLGAMKELKGTKGGHLIVSVATTANYFVTQLLAEFSRQHEGINITLDVTNRHTLLDQLENHEPDMVIMGEPPKGHGLQSERLMANPLVVIAAPNHPLVSIDRPLLLSDVLAERFIVREKGSGTRSAIERHLHKHSASCKNTLEMRSNETIKHAVEAGLGLGIVSMHTIQPELDSGRLVVLNVGNFPIQRHWHIVMRKGKRLSPIAREFKRFVMAEAPRFVQNMTASTGG